MSVGFFYVIIIGNLICEKYNCSEEETSCDHGNETCSNSSDSNAVSFFCQSTYYINNHSRLELFSKGCTPVNMTEISVGNKCHIDNPLQPSNREYTCYCDHVMCNQNETFTHLTMLAHYG